MISFFVSLSLLYTGDGIKKCIIQQQMVSYSKASYRELDNAENCVIMNGESGSIGFTYISLSYLKDGYIKISGYNPYEDAGVKKISEFELQPGKYTLTGLKGCKDKTVELQLSIRNDKEGYDYYHQYDEDITFTIDKMRVITLYVRVYPHVDRFEVTARPAVYKDE